MPKVLLIEDDIITGHCVTSAYTIPDTPHANIAPGQTGVRMVPINRMVPRSFFTNLAEGSSFPAGKQFPVRGIAFGGGRGVAKVELSSDGGKLWQPAMLGKDYGKYSFRQWETNVALATKGDHALYGNDRHRSCLLQATRVHEDIFDKSIDVQVLRLRRKLEIDPSVPRIIRTERFEPAPESALVESRFCVFRVRWCPTIKL